MATLILSTEFKLHRPNLESVDKIDTEKRKDYFDAMLLYNFQRQQNRDVLDVAPYLPYGPGVNIWHLQCFL